MEVLTEVQRGMIADRDISRLNDVFEDEAIRQWDLLSGRLPPFKMYLTMYIYEKWKDMVMGN